MEGFALPIKGVGARRARLTAPRDSAPLRPLDGPPPSLAGRQKAALGGGARHLPATMGEPMSRPRKYCVVWTEDRRAHVIHGVDAARKIARGAYQSFATKLAAEEAAAWSDYRVAQLDAEHTAELDARRARH